MPSVRDPVPNEAMPPLSGLRVLDLSHTQVSSRGLAKIAGLAKLERLALWPENPKQRFANT